MGTLADWSSSPGSPILPAWPRRRLPPWVRPPASPGGPCCQGHRSQVVARRLAGRSLVVVIDNCEQVIDAAAALADALVGEVPGLRLITTSRQEHWASPAECWCR